MHRAGGGGSVDGGCPGPVRLTGADPETRRRQPTANCPLMGMGKRVHCDGRPLSLAPRGIQPQRRQQPDHERTPCPLRRLCGRRSAGLSHHVLLGALPRGRGALARSGDALAVGERGEALGGATAICRGVSARSRERVQGAGVAGAGRNHQAVPGIGGGEVRSGALRGGVGSGRAQDRDRGVAEALARDAGQARDADGGVGDQARGGVRDVDAAGEGAV